MKLAKSILLGSAVGLIGVAGAQAADLPSRKSAPVQYVRICDAFGAGFFYIPGTDTCLKVGGLVVAEARTFDAKFGYPLPVANGTPVGTNLYAGAAASITQARARDTYGYGALGRIELDARTATAWGTLRTFVRADAYYGGGTTAATGAFTYPGSTVAQSNTLPVDSRYSTILNKAFIQFGGLTAGYAQSMFDFYADAYNFETLRGSNATSALFAYTATFGGGFSGTISAEDQYSRRGPVGTAVTQANFGGANVATAASPEGGRLPDFVANLRYDAPWGAVQLSGATHYVNASLYQGGSTGIPAVANQPLTTANSLGFAAQLGVQFNLDQLAPGDKLWLQATYQKGASSYTEGGNLSFINGAPSAQRLPGSNPQFFGIGYSHGNEYDCVFTQSGTCDRQEGYAFVAAYKHYWIPTVSSSVYGSYYKINNSMAALNATATGAYGATNYEEIRIGTNLIWTPVKGFDIGTEFFYFREINSGPAINAFGSQVQPNTAIPSQVPKFFATQNIYEGRVRVQRAF